METHKIIQVIVAVGAFLRHRCHILLCAFLPMGLAAQTSDWQYIHQGNKAFQRGEYQTAGSYYQKALQANPSNTRALYDLANVNLALQQDSAALDGYQKVARTEKSPLVRAMASHNAGTIYQRQAGETKDGSDKQKKLVAAIDAYKQALRDNPSSEASRYNMVLCQKQLKKGNGGSGQPQSQPQQQQSSASPLINYARQAEQQTRSKINQSKRQRRLEKNW